jgi:transient receptor potential cation channel subfamily C protein 4
VDPLNRSALVIAVENGNIELIKVLLECKIDVKVFAYLCVIFVHVCLQDGLLYAINEEFVEAVELLLEWEENVHEPGASYVIFLLTLVSFSFLFVFRAGRKSKAPLLRLLLI